MSSVNWKATANAGWVMTGLERWGANSQVGIRSEAGDAFRHHLRESGDGGRGIGTDRGRHDGAVGDIEALITKHLAERLRRSAGHALVGLIRENAAAERVDRDVVTS